MITDNIDICAETLSSGELVAFPTETVFGLGARSDSPAAVAKIFDAKGRPKNHPLISHTNNIDKALSVSKSIPNYAFELAKKFWPGPMTLVLHCDNDGLICPQARGGHDSVAIRVPEHPIALELLSECDFFVSAPSANRFGRVSPTTAQHVQDEFGSDLLILDGGQSEVGIESTIISCLGQAPVILRAGKIVEQEIAQVTSLDVKTNGDNKVVVSGSLENHYSPSIPLYLFENETDIVHNKNVEPNNCAFISLSEPNMVFALTQTPRDIDDYAHKLYSFFHKAEKQNCQAICVVVPPMVGIGIAVNDRLLRAANKYVENI